MTIEFENIKPHGGDRRWAFEELCYLLFASEFQIRGEAVRREGAGGDGGLEGYIHDGLGRVVLGVQAKYFVGESFKSGWWAQMTDSVQTALVSNVHHAVMESYIICTPRTLTAKQQERWNDLCMEWMGFSLTLGYEVAPTFEHWGYSKLEQLLLKPHMRGHLLYWFAYPHFDAERCQNLNRATIDGLHERFMPKLHAPTLCEEEIHRFLLTERFWREFKDHTQSVVGSLQIGGWIQKTDWPALLEPQVRDCKKALECVMQLLGDGCRFPHSLQDLCRAGNAFDKSIGQLRNAGQEYVKSQLGWNGRKLSREQDSQLFQRSNELLGELPGLGNWTGWMEGLNTDAQCCLLLGPAGSGKTHTLAEIVTGFEHAGGRVLFVEGRFFTSDDDPWTQFLRWVDFPGGVRDFLGCFSALATATSARSGGIAPSGLICVDALNETPVRGVWLHRLEAFAAELRDYSNIKLLVSCRDDFADLTLPQPIREGRANSWHVVLHPGLGAAVFDAAPLYIEEYRVRGADVLALASELENPLFLKTFCEAFKDSEVPPGARSLPAILDRYVNRKSQNISDRIGCASSQVREALRELSRAMNAAGHRPLSEIRAREIAAPFHTALEETQSLYRNLCSEGFLHELRDHDAIGEVITVRFAYERVWDYLLTLPLLPHNGMPSNELRAALADPRWCYENENLLSLLAIRLPEEGCGELHDLVDLTPCSNQAADSAFRASIRWRTRASFTDRTEALWSALPQGRIMPLLFRLSFAPLVEHPWNADSLHARLAPLSLGERDRSWTLALNEDLAWRSESGTTGRLIALSESASAHSLSEEQARLLSTSLAWVCATTAVAYRHRAARALACLLRSRPFVAAGLLERFQAVNDPQVFEVVLYAAAACASHSAPNTPGFESLARVVYAAIFAGKTVQPNILIRHYAQVVCNQAYEKGVLPPDAIPERFHPPFYSVWPQILSEADEAALEAEFNGDWKSKRALGCLLSSTRTEQMGGYGDWGRYELGGRIHEFQSAPLTESSEPEGSCDGFDDRIARRYVLGRVLALGLDKSFADNPPDTGHHSRARPPIERIGKKYQWIAFYEILGYLTDHYHYCEYIYAEARPFRSAVDFGLPDLLDTVVPPSPSTSMREGWDFTESHPWWVSVPEPYPCVLNESGRNKILASPETPNPEALLRPGGVNGKWLTLTGVWEWSEPIPCWVEKRDHNYAHAGLEWFASSYALPESELQEFIRRMSVPVVGGGMKEDRPAFCEEIGMLVSFPKDTADLERNCADTFSKLGGTWFTAVDYSTKSESGSFNGGVIPSPQLAKLAKLHWAHDDLDFINGNSGRRVLQSLRQGEHRATIIDAALIEHTFSKAGLRICWRLYGWKWCRGGHSDEHASMREYWALYVLSKDGLPECVGGGTWLAGPDAVEETLPW